MGRRRGGAELRVLVVTAVAAERDAIGTALGGQPNPLGVVHVTTGLGEVEVIVGGVGPAAAAAATATALRGPVGLVLSAGIAGGFAPAQVGDVVVGSAAVFADLGADTAEGFVPVSGLGFGTERYPADPAAFAWLAARCAARTGTVLTVATVTGTAARGAELQARHPAALAEAMEGAGVAAAAMLAGAPFAEVRAISNLVGPRDRSAWRIPAALAALGGAFAAFTREPITGGAKP